MARISHCYRLHFKTYYGECKSLEEVVKNSPRCFHTKVCKHNSGQFKEGQENLSNKRKPSNGN